MEGSLSMMGGGGSSSLYLVSCKQHDNKNMGARFLDVSPLLHHHSDHRRHRNYYYHYNISSKLDVGLTKLLLSISSSSSSSSASSVSCSSLNGQHTIEAETETVRVKFQLHKECSFGQNFLITGDDPVLGLWDPNHAIPLTWSEGHSWTSAHLDLPIGRCIKFKFILMQESDGVIVWQPGPDRVLECFKTDKTMTLCEDWEDPDSRKIIIDAIEPPPPALNQEIHMAEPLLARANNDNTEEPNVSATSMKLVSADERGVPVLVPGLNQYQLDEDPVIHNLASNDYEPPESLIINGSAMLVSTEPDRAKDLILPDELDLKGDACTSNLNPRPEISSIPEIQDSRENEHQERQQVTEEQVTVPPREHSPHNNVKWGHNAVQKLFSIFGIR
uniref:uncharacterized protein LOC122582663 isoform X2 n=1 Tax=Erigeron canadensis TaxID=72917 RepID=UPI001CB8A2E3|nr:uncharacterized protein LOC122582663 isoform X2 [Erigeron canadensis]